MPYVTPFKFLTNDEERYLIDVAHSRDRIIYMDCLALMHDVLAEFGATPLHSVLRLGVIKDATEDSKLKFTAAAHFLKDNVEINMDTAVDLYTELTSGTRQVTRAVALSFVDEYLTHLVSQYQSTRLQYRTFLHSPLGIRHP
jgi:hypothetical protein